MSKYDEFDLDIKSVEIGNDYEVNGFTDGWKCKVSEYVVTKISDAAIDSVVNKCISDNCSNGCSVGPCTSANSVIIRE